MSETTIFDPNSKEVQKVANLIISKKKCSPAMLQTYLGKGHEYVAALVNWLEKIGVVGPENGRAPRAVLVDNMDDFIAKATGKKSKSTPSVTNATKAEVSNKNNKSWVGILIVVLVVCCAIGTVMNNHDEKKEEPAVEEVREDENIVENYVGKDAKIAWWDLKESGYTVRFVFNRANNGGFTDEGFQDFVINDCFGSDSYKDAPFVVTGQSVAGKNVVLTIEFNDIAQEEAVLSARREQLEKKLSIVTAMSACDIYGGRNYRNFKMHSILGRIAEYMLDDDTWLLKYRVDADGYTNLVMECSVTGTNNSPVIKDFKIY